MGSTDLTFVQEMCSLSWNCHKWFTSGGKTGLLITKRNVYKGHKSKTQSELHSCILMLQDSILVPESTVIM